MGRKAEGTPVWESGRWKGRIPLADGTRTLVELPDCPPTATKAKAKESAGRATELERQTNTILNAKRAAGLTKPTGGTSETASDWLVRWEADRKGRGLQTRGTIGSVRKFLGDLNHKPMAAISRSDLEGVVERMDAGVRDGTLRKWKTAHNAWGLIGKAFDDACNSKTRALRVRADNPAVDVRGPDRGERTAKQYLYPSEFLALMACDRVPLRWKRIFALAVYLYVRPGELEALEWEDVDLDRGIINVHRAIDRQRGGTKSTKTDAPRRFPIEPALLPLLHAMFVEGKEIGIVVAMPPMEDWARRLRKYLEWSGVRRAELFADDRTRKQITFYDMRATGISWRAVRGDDPLKIMSAAGHRDFKTTQGYIREAEPLREGFGDVFPPLDRSLLGSPSDDLSEPRGDGHLDVSGRVEDDDPDTSGHVLLAADTAQDVRSRVRIPLGTLNY